MSSVGEGGLFTFGFLMSVLGTGAVVGRFIARKRSRIGFEMDDYLCIPAWLMTLACGAIVMTGAGHETLGQSADRNEDPTRQDQGQKAFGLATIKFSAIFLYRRLFPGRGFNLACSFVAGLIVQWFLTFIVSVIVFGIRRLQHPEQGRKQFTSDNSFVDGLLVVLSVENILVNVALFILPITVLSQLQLAMNRVLKIVAIFLFAAMAINFGIMQLAMPLSQGPSDSSTLELVTGIVGGDDLASLSVYMMWGILQLGCLLLAICLPTFGPLAHSMPTNESRRSEVREQPRRSMSGHHGHHNSPANEPYPKLLGSSTIYLQGAEVARTPHRPSNIRTSPNQQPTHARRPSAGLSSHPLTHSRDPSDVSSHFRMPSASSQTYARRPSEISTHIRQASANGASSTPSYPTPTLARPRSGTGRHCSFQAHMGLGASLTYEQHRTSGRGRAQGHGHTRSGSNGSASGYRTPGYIPRQARHSNGSITGGLEPAVTPTHALNTSAFSQAQPYVQAHPYPHPQAQTQPQLQPHGHARKGSGLSGHLRKLSGAGTGSSGSRGDSPFGMGMGLSPFGMLSASSPSNHDSPHSLSAQAGSGSLVEPAPRGASVSSHAAGAGDPTRISWMQQAQRSPLPVTGIKVKHGFTQSVEERDVGSSGAGLGSGMESGPGQGTYLYQCI